MSLNAQIVERLIGRGLSESAANLAVKAYCVPPYPKFQVDDPNDLDGQQILQMLEAYLREQTQ